MEGKFPSKILVFVTDITHNCESFFCWSQIFHILLSICEGFILPWQIRFFERAFWVRKKFIVTNRHFSCSVKMYLKLIEKSNILLYVPRGYVHLNFTNLYAFLFLSGIKKTQHVWSTCFNQPKVKIIEFFYILEFFLIFESCSFICQLTTYLAGYLWLLSLHSAYNNKISWFSCFE